MTGLQYLWGIPRFCLLSAVAFFVAISLTSIQRMIVEHFWPNKAEFKTNRMVAQSFLASLLISTYFTWGVSS